MELTMPISTLKLEDSNTKLVTTDICHFCDVKASATHLVERHLFEEALLVLDADEAKSSQSCTCEGQIRNKDGAVLDLNGNVIASTADSEKANHEEAFQRRSVAEFWSLVSRCKYESAVSVERRIQSAWEEDVPKRHKKKHATCADYFKSMPSAEKKVAADLKSFHGLCVTYLADLKGALNAAEKSLRVDPELDEAHLHIARAVFRIENPAMGAGEERKTISATCHVAKYLEKLGDDLSVTAFNPTLWLFLKELNHALYLDAVTLSPAFDSIRFYDNVFLLGSKGPACFLDLRSATKYAFDAGMKEVTFLLSPGKYDASLGDVEVPDGARFDIVGNIETKLSGLRWRHVLRNLEKSVVLVASSDAIGFSFAGTMDVSFSRLAFVDSTWDRDSSTPLLSVSEAACATVDSCSFHRGGGGGEDALDTSLSNPDDHADHQNTRESGLGGSTTTSTVGVTTSAVGVTSTSDGVLRVSNSLFFQLSTGALIDDGGRIYLESTTFSDTALSASDSAVVSVKGCDFVNSQLFVHNNCQVEMIKSTFKLQTHHQPRVVVLPLASTAPHCLVKVRKGSTASVSNCRFFAARPVSVERVALDENEGVISNALSGVETTAISIGGGGTQVTLDDNVFSHVDKCISVSDKAKMTMSKNKFLDCGEMVNLSGLAKASLEDNHPCARMIPLVLLDEDTEPPEMKGPNTYRVERRRVIPPSPHSPPPPLESPAPAGLEKPGKGRQFCHHCCGDLVKSAPKKGANKESGSRSAPSNEKSPSTPFSEKDQKTKKKSRTQSASSHAAAAAAAAAPKSPKTPSAASTPRVKSVVKGDSGGAVGASPFSSNNRSGARPSSSSTSVSSATGSSSGISSSPSPRNRSFSSMTPSPRNPSSVSTTPSPRHDQNATATTPSPRREHNATATTPSPRCVVGVSPASTPNAFLFCACGSSYCSRDCQAEDWKDHRHVCGGGKKINSKSRKLSLDLP